MWKHRSYAKSQGYQVHGLYRRIRELWASGKDFEPRKVYETDTEEDAFQEEERRIKSYGFDNLFNSTTVRGRTERDITDALRQALSKGQKDKADRNIKLYGTGHDPEHCRKIGDGQKRKWENLSPEARASWCQHKSESLTGKRHTEERRKNACKKHQIDPDTEKKRAAVVSIKMKALWASGHFNNRKTGNRWTAVASSI